MGPATVAPKFALAWNGITTATATVGFDAGAKAIIQSSVFCCALPVWAVPVLAPTSRFDGKTPAAVPYLATLTMRGTICAACAAVKGCCQTLAL